MTIRRPLWKLRGALRTPLECSVTPTGDGLWSVTVAYDNETMLDESYLDAGVAVERATSLERYMLARGWTASDMRDEDEDG